jgi:endonuclease-3 related protein
VRATLKQFHRLLSAHYGETGWWPGESSFEIAVGAVLVQNTTWAQVETAIGNLKARGLLEPRRLLDAPGDSLEAAIRPSGFFRVKAKRLRSFCAFLTERFGGSMARMARMPLAELRPALLSVHGIGPETADDILLYACKKPVFVVDAYTRRILSRHGVVPSTIDYDALQAHFHRNLEADAGLYGEYHGLLVYAAKDFCRTSPRCDSCPLGGTLKPGQPLLGGAD